MTGVGNRANRPLGGAVRGWAAALAALALVAHAGWLKAAEPSGALQSGGAADALPQLRKVDVCVYAATPSGILAAVAAKREGRSVLIVEPSRWVGGILGAGIKPRQDCPEPRAVGGIARRVYDNFGRLPALTRADFQRLIDEAGVSVLHEHRVAAVEKDGARIVRLRLEHAPPDRFGVPAAEADAGEPVTVEAKVVIDASYEGDVMARAGVAYAIGREPASQYGEQFAGVRPVTNFAPIDPYVQPGDPSSGLIPLVEPDHGKAVGEGDDYQQAYNFRFYVTDDPAKRVAIEPPGDYDPQQYELVGRYIEYLLQDEQLLHRHPLHQIFPGWLNSGEYNYHRQMLVTIAPLGRSRWYQDGDYATRAAIWREHVDYLRGLHHFLSTDPRVPEEFRHKTAALGLDRTHHPDTGGWPHQLYVRVARRMIGRYVLTEADVLNKTQVDDAVGLALFGVDTYPVRRIVVRDQQGRLGVATEGNMFIGGNRGTGVPYGVPYRAITPQAQQCTNLLVPVCFSASYVAYASARMEPVFMVLGESAGVAASQAVQRQCAVQEIELVRLQARLRQLGQVLAWPPENEEQPQ
jgi:hypothetical protein